MIRAYALALGAGTQAFTVGFGEAVFGAGVVRTDLTMGPPGSSTSPSPSGSSAARPYAGPVGLVAPGQRWRRRDDRRAGPTRRPTTSSGSGGTSTSTGRPGSTGSTLTREDDGTTTLRGPVTDQAELHGLLAKVRDLGATLISVRTID